MAKNVKFAPPSIFTVLPILGPQIGYYCTNFTLLFTVLKSIIPEIVKNCTDFAQYFHSLNILRQ